MRAESPRRTARCAGDAVQIELVFGGRSERRGADVREKSKTWQYRFPPAFCRLCVGARNPLLNLFIGPAFTPGSLESRTHTSPVYGASRCSCMAFPPPEGRSPAAAAELSTDTGIARSYPTQPMATAQSPSFRPIVASADVQPHSSGTFRHPAVSNVETEGLTSRIQCRRICLPECFICCSSSTIACRSPVCCW